MAAPWLEGPSQGPGQLPRPLGGAAEWDELCRAWGRARDRAEDRAEFERRLAEVLRMAPRASPAVEILGDTTHRVPLGLGGEPRRTSRPLSSLFVIARLLGPDRAVGSGRDPLCYVMRSRSGFC